MKSEINVLLTGCGAPGAYGIIKCLRKVDERKINIIGVDCDSKAYGQSMVEKFYLIPKASSDDFLNEINKICISEKINVILPLVTKELFVFSKNKNCFKKNGISVCVMDEFQLSIANNKALLLNTLKNKNDSIPKFQEVNNLIEFKKAAQYLGYPEKEFCFKPSISNGSRGFRIVSDKIDKADLLFNEKPNNTYMTYNEICNILSEVNNIPKLVVMEYLPFEEYSVDCLVQNGELIIAIPRLRMKMSGGISINCVTINDEEIIKCCREICNILRLDGNIGIQFKKDKNGTAKILEINPRLQGTIVLCAAAGVNLPYLGIKLALSEPLPELTVQWGVEFARYWEEIYYDKAGLPFAY